MSAGAGLPSDIGMALMRRTPHMRADDTNHRLESPMVSIRSGVVRQKVKYHTAEADGLHPVLRG